MHLFGKALICKSLHRGFFGDCPWSLLIQQKYLKGRPLAHWLHRPSLGIRCGSPIWNCFKKIHPFFRIHLKWSLYSGSSILIGIDPTLYNFESMIPPFSPFYTHEAYSHGTPSLNPGRPYSRFGNPPTCLLSLPIYLPIGQPSPLTSPIRGFSNMEQRTLSFGLPIPPSISSLSKKFILPSLLISLPFPPFFLSSFGRPLALLKSFSSPGCFSMIKISPGMYYKERAGSVLVDVFFVFRTMNQISTCFFIAMLSK